MAEAKADQILEQELQRLGWKPVKLRRRRKNDPEKLAIAARLRRETTLPVTAIAARIGLGTSKTANMTLHRYMRNKPRNETGQKQLGI